jgi:hypothetical protein
MDKTKEILTDLLNCLLNEPNMNKTTKKCWNCESVYLVKLMSMNKKICGECGAEMPWYLDVDQKPLLVKTCSSIRNADTQNDCSK